MCRRFFTRPPTPSQPLPRVPELSLKNRDPSRPNDADCTAPTASKQAGLRCRILRPPSWRKAKCPLSSSLSSQQQSLSRCVSVFVIGPRWFSSYASRGFPPLRLNNRFLFARFGRFFGEFVIVFSRILIALSVLKIGENAKTENGYCVSGSCASLLPLRSYVSFAAKTVVSLQ